MGKSLKNSKLVQRTGKLAFYKPFGETVYRRMQGFTDLGSSKNPKEYSRQYVDEDFERTDITGYSPSISYAFDRYKGNPVLNDIVKITEDELVGENMVREIINVDMTTVVSNNGVATANAKIRQYAVIPDSDGDSTDCLTYSGNFKSRGEAEDCVVTSTDNWETISNVNRNTANSAKATIEVTGEGIETPIGGGGDNGSTVSGTVTANSKITITVKPENNNATVFIFRESSSNMMSVANGSGIVTATDLTVVSGANHYHVVIICGETKWSYSVIVTGE